MKFIAVFVFVEVLSGMNVKGQIEPSWGGVSSLNSAINGKGGAGIVSRRNTVDTSGVTNQ